MNSAELLLALTFDMLKQKLHNGPTGPSAYTSARQFLGGLRVHVWTMLVKVAASRIWLSDSLSSRRLKNSPL